MKFSNGVSVRTGGRVWCVWCLVAAGLLAGLMACAQPGMGGAEARAEEPPQAVQAAGPAAKPGANDRQITLAVRSYLEREHFTRHPIDDEIARRWFGIFLEALDPAVKHKPITASDIAINKDMDGTVLSATVLGTNYKTRHGDYVLPGSGTKELSGAALVLGLKKNF